MCGIYGWFDRSLQFEKNFDNSFQTSQARLRHRGPDGFGSLKSTNFYVEHHLLQIVGTEDDGRQPYFNPGKNSGLIFNGEIYNFKKLREELKSDYLFKTNGDGEVLFAGLELHGERFLSRLRGIFAGFYWSEEKREAFLFRDQFGVKPLYYSLQGEKFFFASEIKPLLPSTGKTKINHQALYEHLRLRYCLGSQTIFQGIEKVNPGEIFDLYHKEKRKFVFEESPQGPLIDSFKESVSLEIPQFPFYSLLSGGIDSSGIAMVLEERTELARFMTVQGEGYEEKEALSSLKDPQLLETCKVDEVHEEALQQMVDFLEEPIGDSIGLIQQELFKKISQKTKVVLSGEGADEIFFGYAHYWILFVLEKLKWLPLEKLLMLGHKLLPVFQKKLPYDMSISKNYLQRAFQPWIKKSSFSEKAVHLMSLFSAEEASALLSELFEYQSIEDKMKGILSLEDLREFDLKNWLSAYNLTRLDKLSMSHSLEVRVPYLDQSYASLALRFSAKENLSWRQRKRVLRRSFQGVLSKTLRKRKKKAFTVNTINSELLGIKAICINVLENRGKNFFNPMALKKVLQDTDHYFYDKRIFNLALLTLWCERFKE